MWGNLNGRGEGPLWLRGPVQATGAKGGMTVAVRPWGSEVMVAGESYKLQGQWVSKNRCKAAGATEKPSWGGGSYLGIERMGSVGEVFHGESKMLL